jgi:hypothetical protein
MAGVLAAGAAPALAADGISSYSGKASGQALTLQVNPNSVANVNLAELKSILAKIDSLGAVVGVKDTVGNTVGSTLDNPTAPVNIAVATASASGASTDGLKLASGAADSAPVQIDAASLNTEINLINTAVHNMPTGTVKALKDALGPLATNNQQLSDALNLYLPELADPITGTLGSPTVNALNVNLHANFGDDLTREITSVEAHGLLTPDSKLALQPFTARAIPAEAFASNDVTNLALVPSGHLGTVSQAQVRQALAAIETALKNVEDILSKTNSSLGLGAANDVLGLVTPTLNGTVGTVTTTAGNVDLSAVNDLVNLVSAEIGLLDGLNGLSLNDVIGNNGSNAISALKRDGATVTASGGSTVTHVDVVKINNKALQDLLGTVTNRLPGGGSVASVSELASIDNIKATAHVTLDGVTTADQHATGSLTDIKLLGRSLESYVNGTSAALPVSTGVGHLSLDDILPAGSSCTINIPGTSTCHGLPITVPTVPAVQTALDAAGVKSLVTVVLTRGIEVLDATASKTHGSASITTLQLTADLNCGAVPSIAHIMPSIPVALTLSVCGTGVQGAASPLTGAAGANAAAAHTAGTTGSVHLVNLAMGVASAQLSTSPTLDNPGCSIGCVLPPNTGNDFLILAALAVAAMAAGVGIQAWKAARA